MSHPLRDYNIDVNEELSETQLAAISGGAGVTSQANFWQMLSDVSKTQHDTAKKIIQNLR
jgi:bacteriocin-like protein